MRNFQDLDIRFQNKDVKYYYDVLKKKRMSFLIKMIFDKILAVFLFVLLSPLFIVISIWIKLDSEGPVFYKQKRITIYGKEFKIFKFRTMVNNADKIGSAVTLEDDPRISGVGKKLRKLRLDEIPQLINVILGDMSFVGTRPEVSKYVGRYSDEMLATLLLPAGITSKASIMYKDEDVVLKKYTDKGLSVDEAYIKKVLPEKMKYNLEYLESFSFKNDLKIMIDTFFGVIK